MIQIWETYHNLFTYYDINQEIAERAAQLRVQLRHQGHQLALVDALSAVIALQNNLIVLTTDQDFTHVPGLQIENWFK